MTQSETNRLAEELHDGIAQDLVGLGYALDLILSDSATSVNTRMALRKVRIDVSALLERTRLEIHDLHRLENSDFISRLEALVTEFNRDLVIDLALPDGRIDMPATSIFHIIKIVREALRNSLRHSDATQVSIAIEVRSSLLRISIADNGTALKKSESNRYGLLGARKRATEIRGTLAFGPTSDGFLVCLEVPLEISVS